MKPREEGKSSSLPALCRFFSLFLFSWLLEDQEGNLPAPLLSCSRTLNLYLPACFLPLGGTDRRSLVSGPGEARLFQAGGTRATKVWWKQVAASHQNLGACIFPFAGGWQAAFGRSCSQPQQQRGQGQRGLGAVGAFFHSFTSSFNTLTLGRVLAHGQNKMDKASALADSSDNTKRGPLRRW